MALWSGSSAADIARSVGCCSSGFVRKANWANSGVTGEPLGTVRLQADAAERVVGPSTELLWDAVVPIYSLSLLSVNCYRSARNSQGRVLGAAQRTLDGEDRSGTVDREGKGICSPLPAGRPTPKPEEPQKLWNAQSELVRPRHSVTR